MGPGDEASASLLDNVKLIDNLLREGYLKFDFQYGQIMLNCHESTAKVNISGAAPLDPCFHQNLHLLSKLLVFIALALSI